MELLIIGYNGWYIIGKRWARTMDMQIQRCIVCGEDRSLGIAIWDQFICQSCEQEMIKTDVQDEKYPFFIKQMRQIWLRENV